MKNHTQEAKPQNSFNIIVKRVLGKTQSISYSIAKANEANEDGELVVWVTVCTYVYKGEERKKKRFFLYSLCKMCVIEN